MNALASLNVETLEGLVSTATEAMLGLSFSLTTPKVERDQATHDATRSVSVQIGDAATLLVITADEESGQRLGSAMFACPVSELDPGMLDDALGELANIVAGQVKVCLGIKSPLGLPRVLAESPLQSGSPMPWRTALLQTQQGEILLRVTVTGSDEGVQS